jgi:hypothetical protein
MIPEKDIHLCNGEPPPEKPAGATHLYNAKPPNEEIEPGMLYEAPAGVLAAKAALPDPTGQILLSPNYTAGMPAGGWKGVCIHFEAGYHDPSVAWLRDRRSQASAHWCIRRDGHIVQLVWEKDRAWHARSSGMYYFGIEHEGGPPAPYFWTTPSGAEELRSGDRMLIESAKLTAYLCSKYDLEVQHDFASPARRDTRSVIAGHDQMSGNDHWDPGPTFPWRAYVRRVKELAGGKTEPAPKPTPKPSVRWINCVYHTSEPAAKRIAKAMSEGFRTAGLPAGPTPRNLKAVIDARAQEGVYAILIGERAIEGVKRHRKQIEEAAGKSFSLDATGWVQTAEGDIRTVARWRIKALCDEYGRDAQKALGAYEAAL